MDDERLVRLLPVGLLVLATAVATAVAPSLGEAAADVRLSLAVSLLTLLWMALAPAGRVHWLVRSALAFALCWLNPFYAVFGFVGFLDVFQHFERRALWAGLVLVAVTQAGAQSGGLPPQSLQQALAFAVLVLVNAGLAGTFSAMSVRTENRNAALEQALAENAALHEELVVQARERGVQDERQRLAREIHDTIAQSLAGIVTQLEAAVGGERQERALALAREALGEARRSVLDLAPQPLDGASLPAALASVVRGDAVRDLGAELVVTGDPQPLHPEVESTVLRVVQEALTNVAKHAGASRVAVTLSYDGAELLLDVRDDGVGFDPAGPVPDGSFGLRGMRQRAERLAGALTVESRPGRGTAISLRLPALAREAA